ncbi:putative nucleotidyltransferase [Klosneuvirus KNV1]|uniref:Putative nucleotidyltransferase n=1 Tax=Klosneuvirus KNV1 TaxID=1977640 RepID=A0A1V0SHU2_9VIRU|nr:putative nucleotidyltransferase [Klosneuvirus KNV1]
MDKIPLIQKWLQYKYHNQLVYCVIYGSLVYGTSHHDSDIDLIIVLKDDYPNIPNDTVSLHEEHIGHIDITYYSITLFNLDLKNSEVKAVESIFIPEQFIIIGNQKYFQQHFVCTPQSIRHTFGKVCRNAWNKGVKKLTRETEHHEHNRGKKSLYHSIRLFHFALQLYENKRIDFNTSEMKEINNFYFNIKDKKTSELVQDNKLIDSLTQLYNQWDHKFKQIPKI